MTRILRRSVVSSGLTLLGLVALASPALAQSKPASRPAAPAAPTRVHNIEIEGDKLVGEIPQPMSELTSGRGQAMRGSLIQVRTEFTREIAKAAEDL